ncbi:MAG: hypothetical protein NT120_02315, partial [Candidatus Aenigmarchaeota archaeon]|nr:hypothetical protein [Candidatus Aenigmarchaeota archaeon]
AVVFGLLSYSDFLKFDKRVNIIIALAVAAFAAIYEPFVTGLQTYMPVAAILLIILFFFVFVKKVFEKGKDKAPTDFLPIIVILAVLILIFGAFGAGLASFVPAGVDPTTVMWAVGIVIVILFFWAAYKYRGESPAGPAHG